MKILHLSYDVPDKINDFKTPAIKNLIDSNKKYNKNVCISLNRTPRFNEERIEYDNELISIRNFGLPKGILFRYMLNRSKNIINNLDMNFSEFDIIHAHKLTFEGPIAYDIYIKHGINYIITLRHTDQVVLKYRKDLINYYKKILLNASKIIIISPWMKDVFRNILGEKFYSKISKKIINIPNIMRVDNKINSLSHNGKYLSVFHLKDEEIKRKNIFKVLEAIKKLKVKNININLDIIGDGPAREKLESKIRHMDLHNNVKCIGSRRNTEMISIMSEYKGFIMCSYPETFGMVFIEALCSGIPLIYAQNTGIAGFFEEEIGISVNHNNTKSICDALIELEKNIYRYKDNVIKLQKNDILDNLFSKESISEKYQKVLEGVLNE